MQLFVRAGSKNDEIFTIEIVQKILDFKHERLKYLIYGELLVYSAFLAQITVLPLCKKDFLTEMIVWTVIHTWLEA